MNTHATKIAMILLLAAMVAMLPSVSSQQATIENPPGRIQPDQISIQNNKLTFATATDNLQIEHTLPGRTLPFDIGYRLSEDRLEPSVRVTLPTDAAAAALRGATLQFQYRLTFNTDISSTYAGQVIPLRSGQYLYLPRFYCAIQIGPDTYTAAGQIQDRTLLSPTEVQIRVGLTLTDTDVDEFDQDIVRDLPLAQGTTITCTDPIVPNSSALNWPGVFYWSNSSSNELYSLWDATGLSSTRTEFVYTIGIWRWTESDYSTTKDVGIICHSETGQNPAAQVINTTTGATVSTTDMGNGGTNNAQFCDVLFWKDSADALLAFETGLADNALQLRTYTYPSGVGAAQNITFDPPAEGNNRLEWFSIKQRPGYNEAAIGWHDTGGNNSVGFILWDKTAGKLYNWTSNSSFSPNTGSGNRFDLAWTADGSKLFMFFGNASSSSSATVHFIVLDRTTWSMSNAYLVGTGGVPEDVRLCTLRGRNDAVVYIAQSYPLGSRGVNVGVILANGSQESGSPTSDSATEGDTSEINLNIECFQEPSADGDMVLTFVDDNALEVEYVLYDPDTKNWSVSALTSANTSGLFASDDIEMTALTPCPASSDCFMLSTLDALSDTYTGAYWNGTNLNINHVALAEGSTTSSGRNPYSFLFANASATGGAAPSAGSSYNFTFYDTYTSGNQSTLNASYDWSGHVNYTYQGSIFAITSNESPALNFSTRSVHFNGTSGAGADVTYLYLGRYFGGDVGGHLTRTLNFTIECWFLPAWSTNQSTPRALWGQRHSGTGPQLHFRNNAQLFEFIWSTANSTLQLNGSVPTDPNFNRTWYHVAVTSSDLGWVSLIVNGTNTSHQQNAGAFNVTDYTGGNTAFYFGMDNEIFYQDFLLDECRIWNRTRSTGDIGSLMFQLFEPAASNGSNTTANESAGRTAIETGITTSELVSPTIDTDMVVYVVTQGGTHSVGTYDKLASAGSKRWAFNYLAGSDAQQNLVNLTPTLYFWEYGVLTAQVIEGQVSGFINSTN